MPVLINQTNGAQHKTAYKKALSVLNQAINTNYALDDYDFSSLVKDNNGDGSTPKTMSYILKNRMKAAVNITDSYIWPNDEILSTEEKYWCPCHTSCSWGCDANEILDGGVWSYRTVSLKPTADEYYVYSFADGTVFGYNKNAENCKSVDSDNCIGFIDVNGSKKPNTGVKCTSGTEGGTGTNVCKVADNNLPDIFPVYIHGQRITPATDAAKFVLYGN